MPNTGTRAGLKKNDLGIFRYSGPIEPARATQQSRAVPQKSSPKGAAAPQSSSPAMSRTKHIDKRARDNQKAFHRERNPADIPAHAWPRQDEQRCSQSRQELLTHQFPKSYEDKTESNGPCMSNPTKLAAKPVWQRCQQSRKS